MRRNSSLPKPQRVDLTKIAVSFKHDLESAASKIEHAIRKGIYGIGADTQQQKVIVSIALPVSERIFYSVNEFQIEVTIYDRTNTLPVSLDRDVTKIVQSVVGNVRREKAVWRQAREVTYRFSYMNRARGLSSIPVNTYEA